MATATMVDRPSIHVLARQFYKEAKGDESKAMQRLIAKMQHDPALAAEALRYAAQMAINSQVSASRDERVRVALSTPTANRDRATAPGDRGLAFLGESILRGLMGTPLPVTHKPLAEARAEDIQAAYDYYRAQRIGHGTSERWYGRILVAVRKDPKKTVKQQLTETDLVNFRKQAEKDEESK